jgi:oligopeptidase A
MSSNPLLDNPGLPAFSQIRPEHVEPAIDARLAACRAEIERLTREVPVPTWEGFVEPLEEMDDTLSRTWSPVSHLNGVMNSEALRAAYNACLPKLSDYGTEVGQNEDLFRAYQAVAAQEHLDATQRKLLDNALRDFHLSGVDLPADKKARYKAISQELSALTSKYSENLLDATNAWSKLVTDDGARRPARVRPGPGPPERRAAGRELGWLLTLDLPSYLPVMTYADNRDLRRRSTQAYGTRASDQGPHAGRWDNGRSWSASWPCATSWPAPRLRQLRRALPGHQDGPIDRGGAGLPHDLAERSVAQARGAGRGAPTSPASTTT